jgi:hypothetical protein
MAKQSLCGGGAHTHHEGFRAGEAGVMLVEPAMREAARSCIEGDSRCRGRAPRSVAVCGKVLDE